MVNAVKIHPGLRVGFWQPNTTGHWSPEKRSAFTHKGFYTGPDLGDRIVGTRLQQELMEGTLEFSVGVLFRPELGRRQNLETILILHNWIPEMFEYEHWEEVS